MRRALLFLALAACTERERAKPIVDQQPRRVIEPPSGSVVRALPPFAIQKDGVGPYKLGEPLDKVLENLPSGPRVALFDIPGVVHRNLIRTEEDTVLVAGEPTSVVGLVAVIGMDVARTESGAHVGATREELAKQLGPAVEDPDRARDPRVLVPSAMRNLRVIMDGDRASALVLVTEPSLAAGTAPTCARPAASEKTFGSCLDRGEIVEIDGDDLALRLPDAEKPFANLRIGGLVFAAPLRNLVDGRDELVAISRTDDPQLRTWTLHVYRLIDGGRLVRSIEPVALYQLSSSNARWIGADLRDVDLFVELESRPDAIEVGGLLTTKSPGTAKIRDVVAISPVPVTRRHGKVAELNDAGVEATDAGPRPKP